MATKTAWADLKSKFRQLRKIAEAWRLTATYIDGEWLLGDWPRDPYDKKRLKESFEARACDGIELVGKEGWGGSLDQWLDRLRANGRGKRITTMSSMGRSGNARDRLPANRRRATTYKTQSRHPSNTAPGWMSARRLRRQSRPGWRTLR